jgi:hypothetical protein
MLFCDGLRDTLAVTTFELKGEKVTKPSSISVRLLLVTALKNTVLCHANMPVRELNLLRYFLNIDAFASRDG